MHHDFSNFCRRHPLLLATTPPTKQAVENEYNHGRELVRIAHHLRGLPCPLRCRNAVGEHGGHLHLRSLNCGVLTSSFNGVADELNTQHVRLIKESASLVIMLAASIDDCEPKMNKKRSWPRPPKWAKNVSSSSSSRGGHVHNFVEIKTTTLAITGNH